MKSQRVWAATRREIFAIADARSADSAVESAMKAAIVMSVLSGVLRMPTSFVAAVTPFHLPLVPVLCMICQSPGTPAFRRSGKCAVPHALKQESGRSGGQRPALGEF